MYALLRTRLLAAVLLVFGAGLIGCGGGASPVGQGPGLGDNSNNAMLQGQYAFALSGQDTNGPFFLVGSFTADGQGHLGGIEDVNSNSIPTRGTPAHFSGTYAVGTDGRGNAVLGLQPGCPNWQFTMLSHAHALLTCVNTNITGSGTVDLQDAIAFTTSALKGSYVFGLSGLGISSALAVVAGDWTMDGAGNLARGEIDVNDFGSISQDIPLTGGSYSVASNGRGTATISSTYGTQNFVFYVVNATDFKLLEIDSTPMISGEVLKQASGPFTAGSLTGTYAFTLGGADVNNNPIALGGLLPADGGGNIVSGVVDVNDGGSVVVGDSITGPYTVNATGRGLATLTSSVLSFPLALYTAANGTLELVNLGGSLVASGMAKAQAGAPFSTHSMTGNYAVNLSGTNLSSSGEEDIAGQLTADGGGNLGGVIDVNNSGSITTALPLSTSSYMTAVSGRGSASINVPSATFSLQTYQIDANTVLFLDVDGNRVLTGIAEKQQF